jgi:hypothetical protein
MTYGHVDAVLDPKVIIYVAPPPSCPTRSSAQGMSMTAERSKSVLLFACFVGLLILLSAYCTDRDGGGFGGDFDELVLYNPAYTLAHFGKLTFPASWFCIDFDLPLITHPPIHTGWIGYLMRLGFSIYYAEATPVVLLLLLCLIAIVRSVFPTPVKLGLLFSIGFFATSGETMTLVFGTRPEGEVHAAWFLGLVLLESGRLEHWNRPRLFAGAFFLTWASGVHYYAALAFTGVAVYLIWAVLSLGWREARGRVIALCAGGCLFGVPYLALYLIPYFHDIQANVGQQIQGTGGVGLSISRHLDLYRAWFHDPSRPALVRVAMSYGVPLLVFSTALLAAIRVTRGLALAAFPLQFAVLTLTWHKAEFYLLHECALFAAAISIALLISADLATRRLSPALHRAFPPIAAALLCLCLVWRSPMLAHATVSLTPKVHEADVARAAARQILGPHARVTGREAAWFSSGAEHWYDNQQDMDPNRLLFDPPTYFSNLDAVVNFLNNSSAPPLTSWYSDGTLKLRGFFFGETSDQLRLVFLTPHRTTQVAGYAARNGQLYRFQEETGGDYEVLSAVCPPNNTPWLWPWRSTYSSILNFPQNSPDASKLLVTILAPRSAMSPEGWIGQSCREISRIPGTLRFVDKQALLASSMQNDRPMHFYRILDDMPGYTGVGLPANALPPPDTTRLDGIIDLSKAISQSPGRVQFQPGLRVTTAAGMGTFSALIPVNHAESIATPCWVTLRLQVRSGRVGFAAFNVRNGIVARTPEIAKSQGPQTVALRVSDFRSVTHIAIFNESTVPNGGLVDVLDATVLIPKDSRAAEVAGLSGRRSH